MLAVSAMGGFNGFTQRDYEQLTDREVIDLLSAEFDAEGRLLTEAEVDPKRFGGSGSVRAAMRELPSPESLGLTDELLCQAQAVNPHVRQPYLVGFFQVWRKRGLSVEQTMERWKKKVGQGAPGPGKQRRRRKPLPREEQGHAATRTHGQDER